MIKPDIIVCWPRNCDYPLWRQFIRDNRDRFNLVVIVFTETHQGEDYRTFIREAMFSDYVLFVDSPAPRGDEDWRNVGIHSALIHSYNAQWIWFTEQDFIVRDGFWDFLHESEGQGFEVVATYDVARMHPCNIFISRQALMEKTRRNFGIVPNKLDHFGLIQANLHENGAKIAVFPQHTYEHLNGLSHNMTLIYNGGRPNWQPEVVNDYLIKSLQVSVPTDERWRRLIATYFNRENISFPVKI